MADESVDLVIANRLPNGIADPGRRFHEFRRVLRPGGRAVLLSMHPCFYAGAGDSAGKFSLDSYFGVRTVEKKFSVEGLVSPAASVQQFFALETYLGMIMVAGFAVVGLHEPHPTRAQRSENPWWDTNFDQPMFMLPACVPLVR